MGLFGRASLPWVAVNNDEIPAHEILAGRWCEERFLQVGDGLRGLTGDRYLCTRRGYTNHPTKLHPEPALMVMARRKTPMEMFP